MRLRPSERAKGCLATRIPHVLAIALAIGGPASAEDITTLDGTRYADITSIVEKPGSLEFSCAGQDVRIPFRKLALDVQLRHHHDPLAAGLAFAKRNDEITLQPTSAFRLKDLAKAKAKAVAEGRPLGFMLVWKTQFGVPAHPWGSGGQDDTAGFVESWRGVCVLVYVFHETELGQLPPAVKKGLLGPEEGGWSPNLCVTDSTCTDYICEIPLGGPQSDGAKREGIFKDKMTAIATWLQTHPLVDPAGLATMAAESSATAASVASGQPPAEGPSSASQAAVASPAGSKPAAAAPATGADEEP